MHLIIINSIFCYSQFAPKVGESGSTAIYKDSSLFISWVKDCQVTRGFVDISNISLGYVDYGQVADVKAKADNLTVSLGDGGVAVVSFDKPIVNGNGYDFAVFENSFSDSFLELAYVEVSSDGLNFYRFNSTSQTQTNSQIATFGEIETININNLAGKYRGLYGTPFDLEELKDKAGLDVYNISHIKIIDVVGSINSQFANYDYNGNIINDPFPTPFPQGGFDLDAVGVIHNTDFPGAINDNNIESSIKIFPTLISNGFYIENIFEGNDIQISISDLRGKVLINKYLAESYIDISCFKKGFYFVKIYSGEITNSYKILKL
ncbi:MAG: hypothetical protein A2046_07465 [Bacteroidetes bacterium GWA2_30_7]|nr:MAG: hypothetical protein A2046_07465 [Bacteroidetes bacterium GWA2_30_7]